MRLVPTAPSRSTACCHRLHIHLSYLLLSLQSFDSNWCLLVPNQKCNWPVKIQHHKFGIFIFGTLVECGKLDQLKKQSEMLVTYSQVSQRWQTQNF